MTPDERKRTAADIARALARGYDQYVAAHGQPGTAWPSGGSYAVRAPDGRYEITTGLTIGETQLASAAAIIIERDGERFAVCVVPLADQARRTSLLRE